MTHLLSPLITSSVPANHFLPSHMLPALRSLLCQPFSRRQTGSVLRFGNSSGLGLRDNVKRGGRRPELDQLFVDALDSGVSQIRLITCCTLSGASSVTRPNSCAQNVDVSVGKQHRQP
ncbi:hypothetical protein J6590_002499 [Homalodisca vitripennis]|nr:hypothetical protein J6590_002499 [Homalodisca vitripennis]